MSADRAAIATTPGESACTVCGARGWREEGLASDFEYETCSNVWAYRSCSGCGHVQIHPLPAPETLRVIYPPTYYSYVMEDTVHPLALRVKQWLDRSKFRGIVEHLPRAVTSYLDVGCGDGRYLQMMIDSGADRSRVYGVELDARAVGTARAQGLQVLESRIEDAAELSSGAFDLITMFHVIEHVERPDRVILRLKELLAPGGILAIETPNFACIDARLARRRFWGGYHAPRHWHVFTTESLRRLLTRSGLTVQRVRYQTGHAFLLWTLHHWLKYGRRMPRLAAWAHPLKNVPLLALATGFDLMRIALGFRTSAMLMVAQKAS